MKREAKLLLNKACDALVLSIELFNRPHDRGRVSSTLIQLDQGFEILMKAAILQRGGKIRDRRAKETIGFDACVRRSLSDGKIKYLSENQALVLQTINGLRDAAQHHLLYIAEGQLYLHVQSGVTLFRDLLQSVFDQQLTAHLPDRVLPVSTLPPTDLETLFDSEVAEIKELLRPGKRRQIEALVRLRPLAILDGTIQGEKGQPSDSDLRRLGNAVTDGNSWDNIFKGVAAIDFTARATGPGSFPAALEERRYSDPACPRRYARCRCRSREARRRIGVLQPRGKAVSRKTRSDDAEGACRRGSPRPARRPGLLQGVQDREELAQEILPESSREDQGCSQKRARGRHRGETG